MQIAHTLVDLSAALRLLGPCALVPTMGNLHEGHLALVRRAQQHGLPVVISVFVNRLQFAPHEDFDQYPRTLAQDAECLSQVGAQLLFAPTEAEFYPQPQTFKVVPDAALADILEGQFRPGFFTGVSTVVMKLLACVQPQVAVFGKKDYQQLKVIEQLVRQFALPITIDGVPTSRAPDGLALSSRNAYLSAAQRSEATQLIQALRDLAARYQQHPDQRVQLEKQAHLDLQARGWQPDYLTIRRRDTLLASEEPNHHPQVVLGAARLGPVRLIDNLEF